MGISPETIVGALAKFSGAKRRFETKGKENGIWVVDDYAHHPTEIGATLQAAKETGPNGSYVYSSPTGTPARNCCMKNSVNASVTVTS